MLSLEGLDKYFGSFHAVDEVDLEVAHGEFLVLVGPSGCGKSTILRMIAGLEMRRSFRRRIDLPLGLGIQVLDREQIEQHVVEVAQTLEIHELLERFPAQLSGGQKQRVALGRAIIRDVKLLLMDEPLSNLDAELRTATRTRLIRLHRQLGRTTVYVTHDQVEAMTMGTRIVVMNEGRILQVGTPDEIYRRPATAFVGRFIGQPGMNLLRAKIVVGEDGSVAEIGGNRVAIPARRFELQAASFDALVGIRPEHLSLHEGEIVLEGRVEVVESLGREKLVHVDLGGQSLTAAIDSQQQLDADQSIELRLDPDALQLFDPLTERSLLAVGSC